MIKKRAARNKTISLSSKEEIALAEQAIKFSQNKKIDDLNDKIIWQDTFYALRYLPDNFVDLMVVDPPYNLTKNFGERTFKQMQSDEYCKWLDKWLSKVKRVLKPNASLYICTDWKSSIMLPQIACKYFILQNRISWEREKGRAARNNWKNCLEDIWFFTNSQEYKFNLDAVKVQKKVLAP